MKVLDPYFLLVNLKIKGPLMYAFNLTNFTIRNCIINFNYLQNQGFKIYAFFFYFK